MTGTLTLGEMLGAGRDPQEAFKVFRYVFVTPMFAWPRGFGRPVDVVAVGLICIGTSTIGRGLQSKILTYRG
jgi:hypothetical protein